MIILFDLDGTLIDSTEAILEGFHHSFDFHKHLSLIYNFVQIYYFHENNFLNKLLHFYHINKKYRFFKFKFKKIMLDY
ncbi:MAG: HAD hydrolase-like protein [Sulfurimonas sp.]